MSVFSCESAAQQVHLCLIWYYSTKLCTILYTTLSYTFILNCFTQLVCLFVIMYSQAINMKYTFLIDCADWESHMSWAAPKTSFRACYSIKLNVELWLLPFASLFASPSSEQTENHEDRSIFPQKNLFEIDTFQAILSHFKHTLLWLF